MRKLTIIILSAILMAGFYSCKKDSSTSKISAEDIKICISGSQNKSSDLKSGSITSSSYVKNGDTAKMHDSRNIITIFSALDPDGNPIDGYWSIYNLENDIDINRTDTIATGSGGIGQLGELIATKLKFYGLYEIKFKSKAGTEVTAYLIHAGTPGMIRGSIAESDVYFKWDRNLYQIANKIGYEGFTMYIKYNEGDFTPVLTPGYINPALHENFKAFVLCGGNNFYAYKGGGVFTGKEMKLKQCKYSPGYYCVSILSEFMPPINGKYEVYFYSGIFAWDWYSFDSVYHSNWGIGNQIVFNPSLASVNM